jgi:glutaredoxin
MTQSAILYRMAMDEHVCPYGLKAKALLKREGFEVEDHKLITRGEVEAFKAEKGVQTTPQIFIQGTRIGGYDDLRRHLGKASVNPNATSYKPVIALFSVTALMALAASHAAFGSLLTLHALSWFIAFSMCALAILKLQNLERFSSMFLGYDLLAQRWVSYAYIYPFAQALAGVLMIAGVLMWIAIPLSFLIGGIGAASVFKAVYIDKRELKCACVGGASNVPLGFVSFTEDLAMVAMAIWMAVQFGSSVITTM